MILIEDSLVVEQEGGVFDLAFKDFHFIIFWVYEHWVIFPYSMMMGRVYGVVNC